MSRLGRSFFELRDAAGEVTETWVLSVDPNLTANSYKLACESHSSSSGITEVQVDVPFTRFGSIQFLVHRDFLVSGYTVDAEGTPLKGKILLPRLLPGKPVRIQILATKEYGAFDAYSVTWNRVEGRLYVLDAKNKRILCTTWPGRRARTFLPEEDDFLQVMDSKGCKSLELAHHLVPYSPPFQRGIVIRELVQIYPDGEKWKTGGTRGRWSFDKLRPDMEDGRRRSKNAVLPVAAKDAKARFVETGMLEVPSNPSSEPSQLRWTDYQFKKRVVLDLPFTRFGSMKQLGEHHMLLSGNSVDADGARVRGHIVVLRLHPGPDRTLQVLLKQDYPGLDVFSCDWNRKEKRLYVLDASKRRILHAPWSGVEKLRPLPLLDKFQKAVDRRLVSDLDMSLGRGLYCHAGLPGVVITGGAGIRWLREEDKDWNIKRLRSSRQLPISN